VHRTVDEVALPAVNQGDQKARSIFAAM
jgi:hypothetical protein